MSDPHDDPIYAAMSEEDRARLDRIRARKKEMGYDDLTGLSQTPAFEDVVESLLRKQVEILEKIDAKLETVMKLVVPRQPDPGESVPATQAKGNGE